MNSSDPFEKAKEVVQEFLSSPPPQMGSSPGMVQLSYPHLLFLVQKAYKTGIEDERSRRNIVQPFTKEADLTCRFKNMELRDEVKE